MKNTFLIIIGQLFYFYAFTQDIIIRNNGDTLKCKITSEDSINVYFNIVRNDKNITTFISRQDIKAINNLIESKNNIDFIRSRGSKFYHQNEKISKDELEYLLSTNNEAYKIYNNAMSKKPLAYLFAGVGGFVLGRSLIANDISSNAKTYGLISSISLIGIGFIFESSMKSGVKRSVEVYNSSLLTNSPYKKCLEFNFGYTPNGIGLVIGL